MSRQATCLTKYLRENEYKSFKEIAKILNREPSTIYNTYNNSKRKYKQALDVSDASIIIPFTIFNDRNYSVLESIAAYLKDKLNLSFKQISSYLNRNYNTVKTVYRRYHEEK